jgi:hypothetical protein
MAEINEIETKKTYKESMKQRAVSLKKKNEKDRQASSKSN